MSGPAEKIAKLLALATRDTTPDPEALSAFRRAFVIANQYGFQFRPSRAMSGFFVENEVEDFWRHIGRQPPAPPPPTPAPAPTPSTSERETFRDRVERELRRRQAARDGRRPNRHSGSCWRCGVGLPSQAGFLVMADGYWRVTCLEHLDLEMK